MPRAAAKKAKVSDPLEGVTDAQYENTRKAAVVKFIKATDGLEALTNSTKDQRKAYTTQRAEASRQIIAAMIRDRKESYTLTNHKVLKLAPKKAATAAGNERTAKQNKEARAEALDHFLARLLAMAEVVGAQSQQPLVINADTIASVRAFVAEPVTAAATDNQAAPAAANNGEGGVFVSTDVKDYKLVYEDGADVPKPKRGRRTLAEEVAPVYALADRAMELASRTAAGSADRDDDEDEEDD